MLIRSFLRWEASFVYAFTPHAAVGGFAGSTIALAKMGEPERSIPNEAGFGTAPTAHASASRSSYQTGSMGRIRSNGRHPDRMYSYGSSDADHRYVDHIRI